MTWSTSPTQPARELSPPSSTGSSSPNAIKNLVPFYAKRETLFDKAKIDCRTDDALLVTVRINTQHPDGVPTIDRQQYTAAEDSRRKCVIRFIGSPTGLNIVCPTIPRYLLQSGPALTAAINTLTSSQRAWHDALATQATNDFDIVRGDSNNEAALPDACEWLWDHLLKAVSVSGAQRNSTDPAPLWNDRAQVASSWTDLLGRAGSRILRDSGPAPKSKATFHSYQLLLQGGNNLVTHILACQLSSYGLLRAAAPAATKEWDKLLRGDSVSNSSDSAQPADPTDSSSSDSEDGWTQQRATRKRIEQRNHRNRTLPKRVTDYGSKHMVGALRGRCLAETGTPLLALSTTIQLRAWEQRYTSCLLSNFESMGCDTNDLAACPLYQKISTSIPGLTSPNAAWIVRQYNGGAQVALYIREDSHVLDLVPTLNDKIKLLLPGTQPYISVKASFHETNARGRIIPNTPPRFIFFTERPPVAANPKPVSQQRATLAAFRAGAATSPPPPGSWAAAVLHGAKRLAEVVTLNHRPKKSSKQPSSDVQRSGVAGSPPKVSPRAQQSHHQQQHQRQHAPGGDQPKLSGSQATHTTASAAASNTATSTAPPALDILQTSAWQELVAHNAALEQRLTAMENASTTMYANISRTMNALTAQLDKQQVACDDLQRATHRICARLDEQHATNATFLESLRRHSQELHLSAPSVPTLTTNFSAVPQHTPQPSPRATSATGAGSGAIAQADHPMMGTARGAAFTEVPPFVASANTPARSASLATPAPNGEAARHG